MSGETEDDQGQLKSSGLCLGSSSLSHTDGGKPLRARDRGNQICFSIRSVIFEWKQSGGYEWKGEFRRQPSIWTR